jgi:hypothetical protein
MDCWETRPGKGPTLSAPDPLSAIDPLQHHTTLLTTAISCQIVNQDSNTHLLRLLELLLPCL